MPRLLPLLALPALVACGEPPIASAPAQAPKAQTGGTAEVLFDEGVALFDAGKLEEACQKFEDSERLEHASGTLFNLADCYEKTGRLASAFEAFNRLAIEYKQAGKAPRAEETRHRADALKPRLAKLVIQLSPEVTAIPGVRVERNGALVDSALWGKSVPVDAGEQSVIVSAPGKTARQEKTLVREADTATIEIDKLEDRGLPRQRIAAIAVGGVGAAVLITGSVVGLLAISKWNQALDACKGASGTQTACPTPTQVSAAQTLGSEAKGLATISTIGFVIGGAGLATAAVLWFLTPKDAAPPPSASLRFLPAIGPGGFGGVVSGEF